MTLTDLIANTRCLLIDFDGPICSVFAGHPAAAVADELRTAICRRRGDLPLAVADLAPDPLQILVEVAALGDDSLTREIGDVLRDAEITAVAVATPTPGANDLLRAAHKTGLRVAIVSNNASAAIDEYLRDHDLIRYVDGLAARFDGMNPRLLKPHPYLLEQALSSTNIKPSLTAFVGDSITDIEAGRAVGIRTIGYANKPGKRQRLTEAGAEIVIDSMHELTEALHKTGVR